MFDAIIRFSLENKLLVLLGVLAMALAGVFSATQIPLDAVPDITNNQVQLVSVAPTYAPEEVEQLITYPLEAAMTNIPKVLEIRSISRYGLSVITLIFEEEVPTMLARQFVQEQLNIAVASLPLGVETELMPTTTGLGEIYQYVLTVDPAQAHLYDATQLRTIQDWIVKRQLNGTKGIIEVSSFGGYLKQYEVAFDPQLLRNYGLSLSQVIQALEDNNENSGGSYIEQSSYSYYIRTEGRIATQQAIEDIPIGNSSGPPLRIRDIASVSSGSAKRYGAMTMDGQGEVVGGITLMLKGTNSSEVLKNVQQRMDLIATSLPEGVHIYPYLDRAKLIGKTIQTVERNLIEGGLIVIFVLLLLLGNFRAGLVVASVIPLSMLFALSMMRYFGISANLMSLGAIDFGIVIDGAVIIVEGLLHSLAIAHVGQRLTQGQMDAAVRKSTAKIYRSAAFGVLIILVVFLPILSLQGIEGKTFRPMAQTVSFAILGSLLLSVTYVPVMSSWLLSKNIRPESGFAAKLMGWLESGYRPLVGGALRWSKATLGLAVVALAFSLLVFSRMGGEFIPTLEEGDLAMQQAIKPGSSLQESIRTASLAEKILLDHFPEVLHVVSKIGTAEVPTDPMAIEDADIMIILKDKDEWTSATNREDLIAQMKEKLSGITWAAYEFTQPIQLRFNELMTGSKSDISVKIFGENNAILKTKGEEAAKIIEQIAGAADVKVDQTDGLRQLSIRYDPARLAQYGVNIRELNQLIRAAYAGEVVGQIYEEERSFDLVVRLAEPYRQQLDLSQFSVPTRNGQLVALSELATMEEGESPMLISREQARRFINVGVNVRDRDVASLVAEISGQLNEQLALPPGYSLQYGGQFENLRSARQRLLVAVPIALGLILLLLYMAFGQLRDALIIFVAVPLSTIGGIWALELRGMPFSISSGIGFIALFGIAVLNGIVLLSAIKDKIATLSSESAGANTPSLLAIAGAIVSVSASRLRPVLMTAAVAAFGFLPMALSTGSGAEVQRPLATVVIGGLISSTLLTLLVLPALYYLLNRAKWAKVAGILLLVAGCLPQLSAQSAMDFGAIYQHAIVNHPDLRQQAAAIQSAALNEKAIGAWAPLQFAYQGGGIDGPDFDHNFSFSQSLNHLFNKPAQKQLIADQISALTTEQQLLGYELEKALADAYNDWAFALEEEQTIDSSYRLLQSMQTRIQLQYEAGALGAIVYELFQTELRATLQDLQQANTQAALAAQRLRSIAVLPPEAVLAKPPLAILDMPLAFSQEVKAPANSYLTLYEQQITILEHEQALQQRLAKQPQLSIGYFAQSLNKAFPFQGPSLGIALPLDQRSLKVKTAQQQLQKEQLQYQRDYLEGQYRDRLQQLATEIDRRSQGLNEHQRAQSVGLQRIRRLAQLQLEAGQIDFLTFSQLQSRGLNQQRSYSTQLHQLNQLIIEYHYLSGQPLSNR